jgi:hypothetical protein
MARRKQRRTAPAHTINVTQEIIDRARREGLSGAQMIAWPFTSPSRASGTSRSTDRTYGRQDSRHPRRISEPGLVCPFVCQ